MGKVTYDTYKMLTGVATLVATQGDSETSAPFILSVPNLNADNPGISNIMAGSTLDIFGLYSSITRAIVKCAKENGYSFEETKQICHGTIFDAIADVYSEEMEEDLNES